MGAQLVAAALARWAPHISDRAFRVLVRMSVTALDKPTADKPAATYYGDRELLALTLRAERGGKSETADRTVRRALTELVHIGAVECVERGRKGKRAVYRLTLDADPRPDPAGLQSPPCRTPESNNNARSGLQSPNSGLLVSPLGGKEPLTRQERIEEEGVASPTEVQTAREDTQPPQDVPTEEEQTPRRDRFAACGVCDTYLDPDGTCGTCSPPLLARNGHHR